MILDNNGKRSSIKRTIHVNIRFFNQQHRCIFYKKILQGEKFYKFRNNIMNIYCSGGMRTSRMGGVAKSRLGKKQTHFFKQYEFNGLNNGSVLEQVKYETHIVSKSIGTWYSHVPLHNFLSYNNIYDSTMYDSTTKTNRGKSKNHAVELTFYKYSY